jgi:hypothetical protein
MIDINNIKHKRIFCFGCSFTGGNGTWADILKRYYGDYPREDFHIPKDQPQRVYNFGRAGAGNYYIFNKIVESSLEYNFNKDDLILIEWSGVLREDRFKDGEWHLKGNVTNNPQYSKALLRDWFLDIEGMIKRDYSYIRAMQKMLKADNIDYEMFSMNGVSRYDPANMEVKNRESEAINSLIELYKDTLDELHPSMFKIVFGDETIWPEERLIFGLRYRDVHPSPIEHLDYLEKVFNFKPSDELRTLIEDYTRGFIKEHHKNYDYP